MRRLTLLLPAVSAFAAYQYYYSDTLTSIDLNKWTQNGSATATSGGLTATSANGGSLISKVQVPDHTSEYEVKTTLTLTASGGTYITYLRASADALSGPAPAGTFYSVELQNPTFWAGGCTATLAVNRVVAGVVTSLGSVLVPCRNGLTMRSLARADGLWILLDETFRWWLSETQIAAGQPGVGGYQMPAGNSVALAELGPRDRIAPSAVVRESIGISAFPNRVDVQWQGAADDVNGTGVYQYDVHRSDGGVLLVLYPGGASDYTVLPSTTYTYWICAIDYHLNYSAATAFTVTTPPAGAIDPRRVGVQPLGAYWGAAGEQIDTLSGNLNVSVPLVKPQGRGGWSVPFALSYNSQLWRQDGGGTWKLGRDVGYGFGWRLSAGSITPYWTDF